MKIEKEEIERKTYYAKKGFMKLSQCGILLFLGEGNKRILFSDKINLIATPHNRWYGHTKSTLYRIEHED